SRNYSFTDNSIPKSIYYYRLKWKKHGELSAYSRIVAVIHNSGLLVSMFPTVASSSSILSFVSIREQPVELIIWDILGYIRIKKTLHVPRGNSTTNLFFDILPKGIYQLIATTSDGKKEVIRFMRL